MIHEYALDPAVVSEIKAFRHIAAGLGMHAGRMVCPFPKEWKKLCYQEAEKHGQTVQYAVTEWLKTYAPKVLTRHRSGSICNLPTWCENAIQEHGRTPFRAIVANRPACQMPPIINATDFDPRDPLWDVPRQVPIQRCAAAFAAHIGPVLCHAAQIRVIDPYFAGDPDQVEILVACLDPVARQVPVRVESVEVHVDGEKLKPAAVDYAKQQLASRYPASLPAATIVRWKSGYLHDRLVLTERGGVTLGDTLREHATRPDHIMLLEEPVWQQWWDQSDRAAHAADLAS
jgi:hypothetical protein